MEKIDVLVVDDEPGIRSGVNRILSRHTVDYPFMDEGLGFNVIEASTGEEAIEIIDEKQPEIVLLDNKLPGIHGVDVLEYINMKQYNILVMMITSYASLDLAVKATNHGAYDFVPKPFTPQELKSSMENITKHLFLKKMTKSLNKEGKNVRFRFLSILSHELKAPLNAIEGYLTMMQEKQAGEHISEYMKMIERSLSRVKGMRSLIMDLLDLTKLESGKKNRELIEADIEKIAKTAIDTILPYAIQLDVKINLHAEQKVTMFADVEEIEIVFNNLISNAVKYNKMGGQVDCFITKSEKALQIRVKDTGIGLSEEEQSRLFDEFSRIKNEKTKNISGSGLGLSIVKKLVELYSGTIEVHSQPDIGSEFIVSLPLDFNQQ